LENLQAEAYLPVTATVTIRSPMGTVVHQQTWSQTLAAAAGTWLNTAWLSSGTSPLGTYSVVQEAWDVHGEYYLNRFSFTLGPLDVRYIYLPMVVRSHAP
jgi:hypothetical protein